MDVCSPEGLGYAPKDELPALSVPKCRMRYEALAMTFATTATVEGLG